MTGWVFYHYDPSMVAAVVSIVLFLLTSVMHLYQLIRTRTWYLIPLAIGGCFEWIGYTGRAVSAQQTPDWTLGPFVLQSVLILVAPALFAASIYMELGRIILLTEGEAHSLIRARWLTKIFVAGDILAFTTQAGGGGISAGSGANSLTLGSHIILVGLFLQVIFFGLFMMTGLIFHYRMLGAPTARALDPNISWKKHLNALYGASVLIMVRSIFRVVEYIQGYDGYLLQHEWYLYVFDAVLMLAVMVLFNVVHPSEVKAMLKGGKYSAKAGLELRTWDPIPGETQPVGYPSSKSAKSNQAYIQSIGSEI